jgi:hypothetical protein
MSSQEFGYWKARALRSGPLGLERGDYHAAQIVTTMANIKRNADVHPEPFRVRDFLPFRKPDPLEEALDLSDRMRRTLKAAGGAKVDKSKRSAQRALVGKKKRG